MDRRHLRVVREDEEPPEPEGGYPRFVEEWVLPYVFEPALLPVLLALLGHVVVVLAPLMLAVWRVGSGLAALLLLVAAGLSMFPLRWEWRDQGRPGGMALVVVGTWLTSVGAAVLCDRLGVL